MSKELADLFVQNTGTHMLDSGGTSGRAWQRNRAAMGERTALEWLESLPEAKIWDVDCQRKYKWIGVQVNTYHHLKACTSYREDLSKGFLKWCEENDEYTNGFGSIEAWVHAGCPMVQDDLECSECEGTGEIPAEDPDTESEVKCLHCDGTGKETRTRASMVFEDMTTSWGGDPCGDNTYNCENHLSQDFMWYTWSYDHTDYTAISIHNGADARGGYTDFVVFESDDNSGTKVTDVAKCALFTDHGDMSWYSDDAGQHWYRSNDEPDIMELPWSQCAHKPRIRKGRTSRDRIVITREPDYGQYHVYLVYENEIYELQASRY